MFSALKFIARGALVCALFLLINQFAAARAATFTVTKTDDTNDGVCDADCSLREAIAAANAVLTNDTINFAIPANDANCANDVCTITLINGELSVKAAGTLTIDGVNANALRLSGNNQSRLFFVNNNANLTLNNLTLRDGNGAGSGGGIYDQGGVLTIANSQIINNTANDFGGGIANNGGTVTLINSTVSNNAATTSDGGGISNYANSTFTVINSVISNNTAAQLGGGIANDDGAVNVFNSTVSGNTANGTIAGGGIDNIGALKLVNVTVAFNRSNGADASSGGGLWSGGTTSLRNTIIAANSVGDATIAAPDAHFEQGAFNSLGNNLIGSTSNPGNQIAWNSFAGTTDVLDADARLASLNGNGGKTPTHALQSGSAAIGKGNACVLTANGCGDGNPALITDQRGTGFARQSNGAVDIGAYQIQTPTAAAVTVSGRVTAANGRGLLNFVVRMVAPDGTTRDANTGIRGQFKFENVPAGANYIFTVLGKRYRFEKATRTLNVNGDLTNVNFVAVQ